MNAQGDLSTAPPLVVHPIAPGERFEAFRAVHVADVDDPALTLDMCSHYEMELPPQPLEDQRTVIYLAVSFWLDREVLVGLARRFDKLGNYIARLYLGYGFGFDYLDPALERNIKHLTVWGTRERLAEAVVDIVPIDSL